MGKENILDVIALELSVVKTELVIKLKEIPKSKRKQIERRIVRLKWIVDSLQKLNSIPTK